ncbi:MAG: hypothetical protein HKM07_08565 [Chlamydiae bacterium]|jgi:hypothetical protein|nr:hypothetical protein [Chlamydiota bacterium]
MKVQATLINHNHNPPKEVLRLDYENKTGYKITFLDNEFKKMIEETGGIQIPPNAHPILKNYRQIAIPEQDASPEENKIFMIAFQQIYFQTQLVSRNYTWDTKIISQD